MRKGKGELFSLYFAREFRGDLREGKAGVGTENRSYCYFLL